MFLNHTLETLDYLWYFINTIYSSYISVPSSDPAFEQGLEENIAILRWRVNFSEQYRATGKLPDIGSPWGANSIVSGTFGYTYV